MKADVNAINPVHAYFNRARAHNVTMFAVMYRMDDEPYYGTIATDELERRLITYYDKLLQDHDGIRLQPLRASTIKTARNLPMRALIEYLHRNGKKLEDASGFGTFEQRVSKDLHGKWCGNKVIEYDIELSNGERVECKGIGSTVFFDSWQGSEYDF